MLYQKIKIHAIIFITDFLYERAKDKTGLTNIHEAYLLVDQNFDLKQHDISEYRIQIAILEADWDSSTDQKGPPNWKALSQNLEDKDMCPFK